MESSEAARILATMQGAWPGFASEEVSNRLWLGYISRVDVAVGRAAAQRLIEESEYKPTVAAWQEACRTEVRRVEAAHAPALAEPVDDSVAIGGLERARDALAAATPASVKAAETPAEIDTSTHLGGHPATYDELMSDPDWDSREWGEVLEVPEGA